MLAVKSSCSNGGSASGASCRGRLRWLLRHAIGRRTRGPSVAMSPLQRSDFHI